MVEEIMIPITLFVSVAVIFWKYFDTRHRENMAMIERGITIAPAPPKVDRSTRYLTWGLLCLFIAVGLITGIILTREFGVVEEIIPAIMILCGGIALLANYGILRAKEKGEDI